MTESEINISTFCTYIFGQFCYISFSNYLVQKKTKKNQSRRKALQEFSEHWGISLRRMRYAAPRKVLIAVNNFFLPVIKFKFYFETKTPVF